MPVLTFQDDHVAAWWRVEQRWQSLQGGGQRVQEGDADC